MAPALRIHNPFPTAAVPIYSLGQVFASGLIFLLKSKSRCLNLGTLNWLVSNHSRSSMRRINPAGNVFPFSSNLIWNVSELSVSKSLSQRLITPVFSSGPPGCKFLITFIIIAFMEAPLSMVNLIGESSAVIPCICRNKFGLPPSGRQDRKSFHPGTSSGSICGRIVRYPKAFL